MKIGKLNLNFKNPFKKENFINEGMSRKRLVKDILRNLSTVIFALFCLFILIYIIVYIFTNGSRTLSWDFVSGNYQETSVSVRAPDDFSFDDRTFEFTKEGGYQSEKWGISFIDGEDRSGNPTVFIYEVCDNSYFNEFIDPQNNVYTSYSSEEYVANINLIVGDSLELLSDNDGASKIASTLDEASDVTFLNIKTLGRGIRGSLITTLYLILITLIIAVPIGVCAAIYLSLFAKKNKITSLIRSLIDMTSAIPSIIFGFIGALVFIPFMNALGGTSGGSILSGSLTLAIMLIPTIVKNTEESIIALPKGYMDSSLALGASRTETVFKVMLPNALPGIITAIILSIGRIIGESAALVFAIGVSIQDSIRLTGSSTSLAVHIWSILGSENPDYDSACAISIIILVIVLVLCLITKLISYRFNKKFKGAR